MKFFIISLIFPLQLLASDWYGNDRRAADYVPTEREYHDTKYPFEERKTQSPSEYERHSYPDSNSNEQREGFFGPSHFFD